MRIKSSALIPVFLSLCFAAAAQSIVQADSKLVSEAIKKGSLTDTLLYVDSAITGAKTAQAKREAYALKALIQEQAGMFDRAAASYALAAAQENPEQGNAALNLSAAYCFLSAGDAESASALINDVLLTASQPEELAKARLYAVWANLCAAQSEKRFTEITNTLQSFLYNPTMKGLKASILFTLWWLTDDAKFSAQLAGEFPHSPEAAITQGKSHVLPAPFCYFVPRIAAARAASAL